MEKKERRLRDALKEVKEPAGKPMSNYLLDAITYSAVILYHIGRTLWRAKDYAYWGYVARGTAIALLGVGLYKGSPTMLSVAQDKLADYQEGRLVGKLQAYEEDFVSVQQYVSIDDFVSADDLSEELQKQLAGERDGRFDDLFAQIREYDDEEVDPGYEQFQLEIRVAEMQTQNVMPVNTDIPAQMPQNTTVPTPLPDYPPVFINDDGGVYLSNDTGISLLVEKPDPAEWMQAELSPDGLRVALVEKSADFVFYKCVLYVINTDGTRLSQVTKARGQHFFGDTRCSRDPFWLDNDTIAYVHDDNEPWQIDIDEFNIGHNWQRYEPNE